jgi:hypothetical protein
MSNGNKSKRKVMMVDDYPVVFTTSGRYQEVEIFSDSGSCHLNFYYSMEEGYDKKVVKELEAFITELSRMLTSMKKEE